MTYTVIGAGIVGLVTAFELADKGHRVRVIDPHPISGASFHAAGMLAPTAEMVYQQDALFGLMDDSAARYPDLLQRVSAHTELPTAHRTEGTLIIAGDPADRRHLMQLAAYQEKHGHPVERLSIDAARDLESALSPTICGALRIAGDHQIDPRVFCTALIDALTTMGIPFEQRTATREDLGPTTIVCAGLGARDFFPRLPLRPVYGDIMRLKSPTGFGEQPLLNHVVRGYITGRPVYIVPRADGTIVVGATSREDQRPEPQAGGVLDLLRDAAQMVPMIRDCDIVETTCGARPGTPDDLPLIGRDEDTGAIISTGYFRHGILLAAWGGALTAAFALGEEDRIATPDVLATIHPDRNQQASGSNDRLDIQP
ncbi:glycine oxidase ThiO [Corynebacterium aquilae]|uniref:glycine oxidase ThiO n=1 Tax=Corynebacterium aquilae TaxID=203263 RepID=UPI000950E0F3|nr:glycine oxidase ThiO [Corynebacterium aquilae]